MFWRWNSRKTGRPPLPKNLKELVREMDRDNPTIRRECLDYLIPINDRHLRVILKELVCHYNRGRPHSALGPGIPEPIQASVPPSVNRHKLPADYRVGSKPILGGLHHEYRLKKEAA